MDIFLMILVILAYFAIGVFMGAYLCEPEDDVLPWIAIFWPVVTLAAIVMVVVVIFPCKLAEYIKRKDK